MKWLFSILTLFASGPALAQFSPDLHGDWTMTDHRCSSGLIPRDGFVPGRDRLEASFRDFTYTTINEVAGCSVWTTGTYEVRRNILVMRVERSGSNCGSGNPPATFSYPISMRSEHEFTLFIGPFDRHGVCPAGDLLENTFTRIHY